MRKPSFVVCNCRLKTKQHAYFTARRKTCHSIYIPKRHNLSKTIIIILLVCRPPVVVLLASQSNTNSKKYLKDKNNTLRDSTTYLLIPHYCRAHRNNCHMIALKKNGRQAKPFHRQFRSYLHGGIKIFHNQVARNPAQPLDRRSPHDASAVELLKNVRDLRPVGHLTKTTKTAVTNTYKSSRYKKTKQPLQTTIISGVTNNKNSGVTNNNNSGYKQQYQRLQTTITMVTNNKK